MYHRHHGALALAETVDLLLSFQVSLVVPGVFAVCLCNKGVDSQVRVKPELSLALVGLILSLHFSFAHPPIRRSGLLRCYLQDLPCIR